MALGIDAAYKSLNKYREELCGDKVEILTTKDSEIVILADGMGSGVKANILATMTSKILATMFINGAPIEQAVQTIARTLPICKVRQMSYSTFSILQIFNTGEAYLVEFDNPSCIFIRDRKLTEFPVTERVVEGRKIRESRFTVEPEDCFVLMSDGVIYAGVGEILNFGWTWESMADYALKCAKTTLSAKRLAVMLSDACDDLYQQRPGDDTTVAVIHVVEQKVISIFTGPPENPQDDAKVMAAFMAESGQKIVCGGTTAKIAAAYLKTTITNNYDGTKDIPPTSNISGIDLVTEGILTLNKVLHLLKTYAGSEVDGDFFEALDEDNGAAKVTRMIIEDCTQLNLFVGKAANDANNADMFDISMRNNLLSQLKGVCEQLGIRVNLNYY